MGVCDCHACGKVMCEQLKAGKGYYCRSCYEKQFLTEEELDTLESDTKDAMVLRLINEIKQTRPPRHTIDIGTENVFGGKVVSEIITSSGITEKFIIKFECGTIIELTAIMHDGEPNFRPSCHIVDKEAVKNV